MFSENWRKVIKMVSIGNKAKLVKSEICQKCAKCCKVFTLSENMDVALRFLWIEDRKIKAEDTPFRFWDGTPEKQITFKFPCSQLEFKDNKYCCKVWDKERPDFCNTYPDHIFYNVEIWNREKLQKLLDEGRRDCPGLEKVSVDDVVAMLREYREGN